MGDKDDGPSGAAQSAQRENPTIKPNFLARIFGHAKTHPDKNVGAIANGNGHELQPKRGMGNLNFVCVEDVAVPRGDIVSAAVDIDLEPLVDLFRESGLTRLPVFEETLDHPLGFVNLKDLALRHGFACDDDALNLTDMLRPLLFAPPSMPIGVLLQKMQTERIHMAMVVDEYGGVDGLVTIEDLIEQVVGEIADEHDIDEGQFWSVEKPGVYLCQAKAPLADFEAEIGVTLMDRTEDDEIETLGGLLFVLVGRVPVRGEVIKHPGGLEFEILDADPRRIKRLRVVLPTAGAAA